MFSPFDSQQFPMNTTYFNSFSAHCHSFEADVSRNERNCMKLVICLNKIMAIASFEEPLIADLIGAA